MEAMSKALVTGQAAVVEAEASVKQAAQTGANGGGGQARPGPGSTATPVNIKTDEDLFKLLGGDSAAPDVKRNMLGIFEATSKRFRG